MVQNPFAKSIMKSLPASRMVCGYEIKKLPIGAYLTALSRIDRLPEELLAKCFPGMTLGEVFGALKTLDEKMLTQIIIACMQVAPTFLLQFVADLSGIPLAELTNNPAIGLAGLVDVLRAIWELNDLGKTLAAMTQVVKDKSPAKVGSRS